VGRGTVVTDGERKPLASLGIDAVGTKYPARPLQYYLRFLSVGNHLVRVEILVFCIVWEESEAS